MRKANAGLRKVQFMRTDQPGLYGGISGSEPIHGMYGRFEILNWAVKFFLDAQMLELSLRKMGDSRLRSHGIGDGASSN
jgi:hypothetical protein